MAGNCFVRFVCGRRRWRGSEVNSDLGERETGVELDCSRRAVPVPGRGSSRQLPMQRVQPWPPAAVHGPTHACPHCSGAPTGTYWYVPSTCLSFGYFQLIFQQQQLQHRLAGDFQPSVYIHGRYLCAKTNCIVQDSSSPQTRPTPTSRWRNPNPIHFGFILPAVLSGGGHPMTEPRAEL